MKKFLLVGLLALAGCVTPNQETPYQPSQRDLAGRAAIDRAVQTCGKATVGMSEKQKQKIYSCIKNSSASEYAVYEKKAANPAYGYCVDSDFKPGTQAMATCMADYNQERHSQFMFERQQEAQRDEANQQAERDRARRRDAVIQRNDDRLLNTMRNNQQNQPVMVQPAQNPERTDCHPDGYGGVTCTTFH